MAAPAAAAKSPPSSYHDMNADDAPMALPPSLERLKPALRASVKAGRCPEVRRLTSAVRKDLLLFAIWCGDVALPVTKALVMEHGVDPVPPENKTERANSSNRNLSSVNFVHMACAIRDASETLRFLLSRPDVDITYGFPYWNPALAHVAGRNFVSHVRVLLEEGKARSFHSSASGCEFKAAASTDSDSRQRDQYACAHVLLDALPVGDEARLGQRVIELAVKSGDVKLARRMLTRCLPEERDTYMRTLVAGTSPLLDAIYCGRSELAEMLMVEFGGWNPEHNRLGLNAIQLAREKGHLELATRMQAFVDGGARAPPPPLEGAASAEAAPAAAAAAVDAVPAAASAASSAAASAAAAPVPLSRASALSEVARLRAELATAEQLAEALRQRDEQAARAARAEQELADSRAALAALQASSSAAIIGVKRERGDALADAHGAAQRQRRSDAARETEAAQRLRAETELAAAQAQVAEHAEAVSCPLLHQCDGARADAVALPCGHRMGCMPCAKEWHKRGRATCSVCRAHIDEVKRVF